MFARRCSVSRSLALLSALLISSTAFSAEWYAVSSDNFTLYSDGPEDQTKGLVQKFEIFRDTALALLGLPDTPEKQPLLIVVYNNPRDFSRISPKNSAGFYYDSIFGPRMLMRGIGLDIADQGTLFHEYVHYLLNQRSQFNYPRWYDEGLATVLMTTEITDTVFVGNPPVYAAMSIKYGSLPTVHNIITGGVDNRQGFYQAAWLLSHYVSLGNKTRREQTTDYLRRYDAGEEPVAEFEASYGMTTRQMDAELAAYAAGKTFAALKAPTKPYSGRLWTRALGRAEALLLLADIAVENDEYKAAHYYFDQASDIGADSPFRARLIARRSIAYIHDLKVGKGDELMGPLLAEGSEDPQVIGDIAHYACDKFVEIRLGEWNGDEKAELERAIEYGVRAVEADPGNLEAHYYLGLCYEAAGQLQNATDALLRGYELSPSPRLNLELARVLIKGGQHELASYLLSRMVSASHDEDWRSSVREIVTDLEDGNLSKEYALLTPPWVALPGDE